MSIESLKNTVRGYYAAWANQDRDAARAYLSDDLDFRSPQDRFCGADSFLDSCWKFSEGLTNVEFLKEVYCDDEAFIVLRWSLGQGDFFADAEYARIRDGKISEIMVVNNAPSFSELLG